MINILRPGAHKYYINLLNNVHAVNYLQILNTKYIIFFLFFFLKNLESEIFFLKKLIKKILLIFK